MKSVEAGESDSSNAVNDAACVQMCGMCPSCVFSPTPPGSTRRLWKMSDEFKRKFLVELLFRCGNTKELESIQRSLNVTSWKWFTYARSRGSPQDSRCSHRATNGKPLGINMNKIWKWFSSSPGWMKSRYLCCIFSLCDFELLRMLSNLTSVLLVRHVTGHVQFSVSNHNSNQHGKDPEDPTASLVPGSSMSISGVSKYQDFLTHLPVNLSKRILGLLDEHTLHICKKVCMYWQHLAEETIDEIHFRETFKSQNEAIMEGCSSINIVSPTYANIVEVSVPLNDQEEDVQAAAQNNDQFEAACAKIKTKSVQMEERNIYCGAYFTKVLLCRKYQHRVLDYRGGFLMATSSKYHIVRVLQVGSETKSVAVLRGHVGVIQAVLLCEERDLLLTAGCDENIRCWNLKTDMCDMVLRGHTGAISCLDVHGDRLVSGANDCTVRVWSLQTWSLFKDFNFKHQSSVLCVKINKTAVYSSCDQGLIMIWDMKHASLLRVVDAHKSSVKCLFISEWHLLSGDSNGKVMAWNISCEAKDCLMIFNHPKEVKSLTLLYLRVVTGCSDGKIRIFNFLTGDCLREITTESESDCILSLHFQEHSILVNTTSSVQLYQFAKVFWDYAETLRDSGDVVDQEDLICKISANLVRQCPNTSPGRCNMTSPTPRSVYSHSLKPNRSEFLQKKLFLSTSTKPEIKVTVNGEDAKQAAIQAERDAGFHHPRIRHVFLRRAGVSQVVLHSDKTDINMKKNALGLQKDQHQTHSGICADVQNLQIQIKNNRRSKTCLPGLKPPVTDRLQSRNVPSSPDAIKRHYSPKTAQPDGEDTRRRRGFRRDASPLLYDQTYSVKDGFSFPAVCTVREQRGFRLFPVTQLGDQVQATREIKTFTRWTGRSNVSV